MKILFVISSNGAGRGGHYNSLDHISQAIGTRIEVKIVSIGKTESPVIKENPYYQGSFKFNWWSFITLNSNFKKLFREYDPDIVHCFDGGAALLLMALPALRKKTFVHTKCGGPNERHMFAQVVGTVILFSEENLKSFKNNSRFKNSDIYHIPNRIHTVELLEENKRPIKKNPNSFTFLRIARIGKSYKKSLLQSVELVRKLKTELEVNLIIIGTIEDNFILREIKKAAETADIQVSFVTNEYTKKASRMLYLADAVIGTGRGAMEAMALGLPVFVPQKNGKLPALITKETFSELIETNFSERGITKSVNESETLVLSKKLVSENDFYQEISSFSKYTAEESFLLTPKIINKYLAIYKKAKARPITSYLFKNIIPLFYYINAYRRAMGKGKIKNESIKKQKN